MAYKAWCAELGLKKAYEFIEQVGLRYLLDIITTVLYVLQSLIAMVADCLFDSLGQEGQEGRKTEDAKGINKNDAQVTKSACADHVS